MLNFHALMCSANSGSTPPVSYIESIEEIEITFDSGSTTGTATITSVDPDKTVVFFNGWRSPVDASFTQAYSYLQLTDSTTVTATRNSSGSSDIVCASVVQFKSDAVTSVQYGVIDMGTSTTQTDTITSINTARSAVLFLGNILDRDLTYDRLNCDLEITNATTVTATRGDAFTNTASVAYVVFEFDASIVDSVQQFSIDILANNTSNTATITSVDASKSIIIFDGIKIISAQSPNVTLSACQLTNGTTVTAYRNTLSPVVGTSIKGTVIEFADGVVNSIQRGNTTIELGSNPNNQTITSVDTDKAFVNYTGFTTADTSLVDVDDINITYSLTSSTNIAFTRGSTTATADSTAYWEVVEFV